MVGKHILKLVHAAQVPYREKPEALGVGDRVRVQEKEVHHLDYAWSLPFDDAMASAYVKDYGFQAHVIFGALPVPEQVEWKEEQLTAVAAGAWERRNP